MATGYRLTVRSQLARAPNVKGPDADINLHVFSPGCPETVRHRVFRDWLRTHPDEVRDRYAAVKRAIAAEAPDVHAYSEAKNDIIDDIYRRAFAA